MSALPPPRRLAGPEAEALVHDQGAQVTSWTPRAAEDVLFVSICSRYAEGSAIRGGVPICFPWFGPGRSGDRTPSHGPARTTPWRLLSSDQGTATYEVTGAELGVQELDAQYVIRAGARLDLALTVTNTGEAPLTFEEALHTYLAVGDVRQVTVEGLEDAEYVDKTDGGRVRRQQGLLRLTGETDRVYHSDATVVVHDPVLGRRLRVSKRASASTVVWNPWEHKAAGMSDLASNEWTQMLCVEGGNVLSDEITLGPGQTHTLAYAVEVLPL